MMQIRDLRRQDMPPVLALLLADHLPAQPRDTARDVQRALAGYATIDQKWCEALAGIQAIVSTEGNDVLGVASCGGRARIHAVGKSMVDQCQKYNDQERLKQKGKPKMKQQQNHQKHEGQ